MAAVVLGTDANTTRIDELGRLLNRVTDVSASPKHASELIDEISQLMWMVSSLDPEGESLLNNSEYVVNLLSQKIT